MLLADAFLRRLARHPDAEGYVLRGGVRVRQLVPSARRPATDVDLVCRLPYDVPAVRRTLEEVLATELADGVRLAPGSLRLDLRWRPGRPGLRVTAADAGGVGFAIDLTFGLPLWPEPVPVALPGGGRLWAVRADTVVGRKVQVTTALGRGGWRPKDLHDLRLLLGADTVEPGALGPAIDAAFHGEPQDRREAREVFEHPAWWAGPAAEARWARFAARRGLAASLPDTVAAVRQGLARGRW